MGVCPSWTPAASTGPVNMGCTSGNDNPRRAGSAPADRSTGAAYRRPCNDPVIATGSLAAADSGHVAQQNGLLEAAARSGTGQSGGVGEHGRHLPVVDDPHRLARFNQRGLAAYQVRR